MHLRSYKHTTSDLRITASYTRHKPSVEGFYNVNSYYQSGGDGGFGRMYAGNGGGGGGLPNPFKVAKAAYDWSSSLKYISNYATMLNFNKPQRNAFRHIFGDLYLYSKGYSVDVINRVQNIHELTSFKEYDKLSDLENNALVDRYIVLNGEISSTSTYNIAKISLSIMTFYGFYIPNEGSPKKENFTLSQFQEFLKIIK
jgi:hypothetical protein